MRCPFVSIAFALLAGCWSGHRALSGPIDLQRTQAISSAGQFACDLNGNSSCTCADIDVLTAAIARGSNEISFDLNHDGEVDARDREFLIKDLMKSQYGDINVDGKFDSADLVHVFQSGLYGQEDPNLDISYCDGDWNGDGVFDSSDIVLAYRERRNVMTRSEVSSFSTAIVPEPLGTMPTFLLLAFFARLSLRSTRRMRVTAS